MNPKSIQPDEIKIKKGNISSVDIKHVIKQKSL